MVESFGRVEDRLAIEDLIQRYALYVDTRAIDKWVDLFGPQAVFDERAFGSELFIGHDQIRAYGQHLAATVAHMIHHTTNIILDNVTETAAQGTVFAMVESRRSDRDHGRHHVIYKDRYAKTQGRWVIAERILHRAFPSEILSASA